MDHKVFAVQINKLTAALGVTVSKAQMSVFWDELQVLPDPMFIDGTSRLIRDRVYKTMPTLAEVIQACCAPPEPKGPWRGVLRDAERNREAVKVFERMKRGWHEARLPAKQVVQQIEGKKTATRAERRRNLVDELREEIREQAVEILRLKAQLREKHRFERIDERRKLLQKQAEKLGVSTKRHTKKEIQENDKLIKSLNELHGSAEEQKENQDSG